MSGKTFLPAVVAAGLLAACGGCKSMGLGSAQDSRSPALPPPEVVGTVAEFASLIGGGNLLVQGHGLVVGLGNNGSSEVPPQVRQYLVQYMLRQKVGSVMAGTSGVTPSDILADKDTAVVELTGLVPPGAPAGWQFDVRVTALSRTGTKSLDGGAVMPGEMRLAVGGSEAPESGSKAWATAGGAVFLNPFLDARKPADSAQLREGRLIGGGKVLHSRPLRLVLREGDYARANLIQRRINQRFGQPTRVANARNPSTIDIEIPLAYRDDYQHFLRLLLHLPLQAEPGRWERRAKEVAEDMQKPNANHDGLALVWEAMGRQVVDVCRTLYPSQNPYAAFYSARTGLRLRDDLAGDVVVRFATMGGSPLQVPAIEELGRHLWLVRSIEPLKKLIDDDSSFVRIAAYEALLALGDRSLITPTDIAGSFRLDMVTSAKSYVIYATRSREPRIVLFGRNMAVSRPVFFSMPEDLVTVSNVWTKTDGGKTAVVAQADRQAQEQLMAFRKIPRTGGVSEPFFTDFLVKSLIETLGEVPEPGDDGRIKGLGLTYGQIVAVLYRLCEVDKDIPAKFVLQASPEAQRIYRGAPSVGRPDMPDE